MTEIDKPSIRAEFKLCLGLLTRLPVGLAGNVPAAVIARSSRWFPLVGVLAGLVAVATLMVCLWLGLPDPVSALVAVAAAILLTGALHEDGLADVADGFGGGFDRETKLAIMRDSRVGTYGVLALILSVGMRVLLLAALLDNGFRDAAMAIIVAGAASRFTPVLIMNRLPPARRDGMAVNAGRPDAESVRIAGALALASLLLLSGPAEMIIAVIAALAACAAIGALARRQIGGQTGDVLGACQQVTEIAVLAGLVAAGS